MSPVGFCASVRRLAAVGLLLVPFSCASHEALRGHDSSLTEDDVFAAARSDDPSLLEDLHFVLRHPDRFSTAALVAAVDAVGDRGRPQSVAVLEELVIDPERAVEEVRWHVALAAGRISGAGARRLLERLARLDPSELVREAAVKACRSAGDA